MPCPELARLAGPMMSYLGRSHVQVDTSGMSHQGLHPGESHDPDNLGFIGMSHVMSRNVQDGPII